MKQYFYFYILYSEKYLSKIRDGTPYYKQQNGKFITVDKLWTFIANQKKKRELQEALDNEMPLDLNENQNNESHPEYQQ